MDDYQFHGTHFATSYVGCNYDALINIPILRETFVYATKLSNATILGQIDHTFKNELSIGNGYTCVIILSESHASIHTYPEKCACFVDLFTCGDKCDFHPFDKYLRSYLNPSQSLDTIIVRNNSAIIVNNTVSTHIGYPLPENP